MHGWIPDETREGSLPIEMLCGSALSPTETQITLVQFFDEIEHQGQVNACVSFSTLSAYEAIRKERGSPSPKLSRYFSYYNARLHELGHEEFGVKDEGCRIKHFLQELKLKGCCTQEEWSDESEHISEKPPVSVYSDAYLYRCADWYDISKERVFNVKKALSMGYPIVFGTPVDENFLTLKEHGLALKKPTGPIVGNHAMVIVGYERDKFMVRNSWGKFWGNDGYFWMSYDWLEWPSLQDLTAITSL